MCGRNLIIPIRLISGAAVVFVVLLLFAFLWSAGRLKNRIDLWRVSPQDVLTATQSLVAHSPAVQNPVAFSALGQTTVEHWDGPRWRVSGYVDTLPRPGVRVRTLYFAVVQHNGRAWDLEDLQLQNTELPNSRTPQKN